MVDAAANFSGAMVALRGVLVVAVWRSPENVGILPGWSARSGHRPEGLFVAALAGPATLNARNLIEDYAKLDMTY